MFSFSLKFVLVSICQICFLCLKTEYLKLTDYGDAHFKLLPFLNELGYNFLFGLDSKNFRRSFEQSLIFCIFIETQPVKSIRNRHVRFFFAMVRQGGSSWLVGGFSMSGVFLPHGAPGALNGENTVKGQKRRIQRAKLRSNGVLHGALFYR